MRAETSKPSPLVSVVIPIFNARAYLNKALLSVSNQDYSAIELLLIDDGSTDGSIEIAQRFVERFPGSRLILGKNLYASGGRNRGLEEATGKYVLFMDHDDWLDSEYLATVVPLAEKEFADVVVTDAWFAHQTQNVRFVPPERVEAYPFFGIFIWNQLFRREFLIQNRLRFKKMYGEDYLFNLELCMLSHRRARCAEAFYYWRQLRDSTNTRHTETDNVRLFECLIAEILEKKRPEFLGPLTEWILVTIGHDLGRHEGELWRRVFHCYADFIASYGQHLGPNLPPRRRLQHTYRLLEQKKARLTEMYYQALPMAWTVTETGRQIKRQLKKQVRRLAAIGSSASHLPSSLFRKASPPLGAKGASLAIFLLPESDCGIGAVRTMAHFARESTALGFEVFACPFPGATLPPSMTDMLTGVPVAKLGQLMAAYPKTKRIAMHLPETFVDSFLSRASVSLRRWLAESDESSINVFNATPERMPPAYSLKRLSELADKANCSSIYTGGAALGDRVRFGLPWHNLPALAPTELVSTTHAKSNLLLFSSEFPNYGAEVLFALSGSLPHLEQQPVKSLSFKRYRQLVERAKWGISFSEKLDTFFLDLVMAGGVPLVIYRESLQAPELREMPNVFRDPGDLISRSKAFVTGLDSDERAYADLNRELREWVFGRIDSNGFSNSVKRYYEGDYDLK